MARRPYTKTEQVQTTLTAVDRQRLDAYAEARKQSRADAIRQLVLNGLRNELTSEPIYSGTVPRD